MLPSISRSISAPQSSREAESMRTRKTILKAGASARRQEFAAAEVAKTNEIFLQKYQELKKFTKKSKANRKEITQKGAWLEGNQYLLNQEQHTESDIGSILESLTISSLSSGPAATPTKKAALFSSFHHLLRDCITEFHSSRSDRIRDQKLLMKRYRELKEMLGRTKSTLSALSSNPAQEETESDKIRRQTTIAVFADILRQMSQAHSAQGADLSAKYSIYHKEVDDAALRIYAMKSETRCSQLSERVEEELEADPENDTAEIYSLLQEWREKIMVIDAEFQDSLAILTQEKEAIHFEYCSQSGCDENDPLGGWKESEHQIMVKEIKRAQTKGIPRSRLTEILTAQLPEIPPDEISRHEDWYRCIKAIQERKKAQLNTFELRHEEVLKEAKEALENARKRALEEKLFREERERHERARIEAQKILHLQRMTKMEELQGKLAEIEQQKLKALEEKKKDEEKRAAEILETKRIAEQFKQERVRYLEAQREAERIRKEEENLERKKQIESAKPKIEQREILRQKRLEDMRIKEEILLAEEIRRGELLNKLAEQVPYFDAIQAAESKLDHTTAAVEAQKYTKPDEETRGHLALNGFADARLFKDARFRLGLALRAAGVHQSAAAAAVIAQLHPRQQGPW